MSGTAYSQSGESMMALKKHADDLNAKLRAANVPMGGALEWLNKNAPGWKTTANGDVEIVKTRFGYEMLFPRFKQTPNFANTRRPIKNSL
jgi:hypothetical protein